MPPADVQSIATHEDALPDLVWPKDAFGHALGISLRQNYRWHIAFALTPILLILAEVNVRARARLQAEMARAAALVTTAMKRERAEAREQVVGGAATLTTQTVPPIEYPQDRTGRIAVLADLIGIVALDDNVFVLPDRVFVPFQEVKISREEGHRVIGSVVGFEMRMKAEADLIAMLDLLCPEFREMMEQGGFSYDELYILFDFIATEGHEIHRMSELASHEGERALGVLSHERYHTKYRGLRQADDPKAGLLEEAYKRLYEDPLIASGILRLFGNFAHYLRGIQNGTFADEFWAHAAFHTMPDDDPRWILDSSTMGARVMFVSPRDAEEGRLAHLRTTAQEREPDAYAAHQALAEEASRDARALYAQFLDGRFTDFNGILERRLSSVMETKREQAQLFDRPTQTIEEDLPGVETSRRASDAGRRQSITTGVTHAEARKDSTTQEEARMPREAARLDIDSVVTDGVALLAAFPRRGADEIVTSTVPIDLDIGFFPMVNDIVEDQSFNQDIIENLLRIVALKELALARRYGKGAYVFRFTDHSRRNSGLRDTIERLYRERRGELLAKYGLNSAPKLEVKSPILTVIDVQSAAKARFTQRMVVLETPIALSKEGGDLVAFTAVIDIAVAQTLMADRKIDTTPEIAKPLYERLRALYAKLGDKFRTLSDEEFFSLVSWTGISLDWNEDPKAAEEFLKKISIPPAEHHDLGTLRSRYLRMKEVLAAA